MIFIALSIILAMSDLLFIYINYLADQRTLNQTIEHISIDIKQNFHQAFTSTRQKMLAIATTIANDQEVQQLFLKGKKSLSQGDKYGEEEAALAREKLYTKLHKTWTELEKKYDFRQIHFHIGPGALSFLRLHAPSLFGDKLDNIRHTVVEVNNTKVPVSGFETGRIDSGIRGVVPVFAKDPETGERVHVGALESGTSFRNTLRVVSETLNIEMAQAISSTFLKKQLNPTVVQNLFKEKSTVNGLLFETATGSLPEAVCEKECSLKNLSKEVNKIVYFQDRHYLFVSFPLCDFLSEKKPERPDYAVIIACKDVATLLKNFNDTNLINVIYGIIAFLLIELCLYTGTRLVANKLQETIDKGNLKLQKALEAEKRSKHRLQTVTDLSSDWEAWVLPDGSFKYISPACETITGYSPEEFKKDPELTIKIVHPDDFEKVKELQKECFLNPEGNKTSHAIFRIITKDGETRWISHQCMPVINSKATFEGRRFKRQDITDKHKVEQLLAIEREMFMSGPVMTFMFQNMDNWPVQYVSKNIKNILGYPCKMFANGSFLYASIIHRDDIQRFNDELSLYSRKKIKSFTHQPYRLIDYNGDVVWVLDTTTIIYNDLNNPVSYHGYLIDITHYTVMENEANQARQRLEMVVEAAKIGIWEWNMETGEFKFNRQWANIAGYMPHEIEPLFSSFKDLIPKTHIDSVMKGIEDHIISNDSLFRFEHPVKHRSGTIRWALETVHITGLEDSNSPILLIGTTIDITDRKDAEKTAMLMLQRVEQKRHLDSIRNIAGAIAHRLNNIMMVIQASLDILHMRVDEDSREMRLVDKALEATTQASQTGRMMLAYLGGDDRVRKIYSIEKVAEEAISNVKKEIPENINIEIVPANAELMSPMDPDQIREVIRNIIINSVESIPKDKTGEIKISFGSGFFNCDSFPMIFREKCKDEESYVFCEIQDNGEGIEHKYMIRLFEPFFTTKFVGRGLGLAVSAGILLSHKGAITVKSKKGKGASIRVLIPAVS